MKTVNFDDDVKFANNPLFLQGYDNFYQSPTFREKYLSKLYKSQVPNVVEVIRSQELLMQQEAGIDCLIKLSNGTRLPVDEKTDRPTYIDSPNLVLEMMSNPGSNHRTEGWAYHRGRYISYSCSNKDETGLHREPLFFFIDENFINAFNRNKQYQSRGIGKSTNGLYSSIIKLIPRTHMRNYLNGINNNNGKNNKEGLEHWF